jgi:hypothetical protein
MRIKHNHIIRFFLALTLTGTLSLTCAGCGTSQNTSGYSQEAEHLLAVWSDYIGVLDKMYASELWALDYVETYLESGSWTDLTKARTACIASARYLSDLSMTEEDLSEEEYLTLANAGIDAGYQSQAFSSLADTLEDAHVSIRDNLLESLECNVFDDSSIDILKEEVKVQRESISCMCRYDCYETNYLLLTLGDDTVSKEFWSSMQEKYPALSTGCDDWIDTEEELKAAADKSLDEYEDTILMQSRLISMLSADLYEMEQIIVNGDLEALTESAYLMSGLPELLPLPSWYSPETTGYLSVILAEDGSVAYPESGDNLADANYGMYIQVEGVSEEDIDAYMELAENYAEYTWKEEDCAAWYIMMTDYHVKIDWEDNAATILFNGEDITFAPVWYIRLQ